MQLAVTLRRRLDPTRRGAQSEDGGFALIIALLVTTAITIAVAGLFALVVPNITQAKQDQENKAAVAAAYAGIDDFVATMSTTNGCRTRACSQSLGATKASTAINGTDETYSYTTDSALTSDYNVRIRSIGKAGNVTRTIVADVAPLSPFLGLGYYSDFESQSPTFISRYNARRTILVGAAASNVNAYDTSGNAVSASAGDKITWSAPTSSGNYSVAKCGQHWYADSNGPGRASYASPSGVAQGSIWSQSATVNSKTVTGYASCDVNFTTGMTFDGPVYSRDALLVSDGTTGGAGPVFNQPVTTLWGAAGYNTPAPATTTMPWRSDANAGGTLSTNSQKPTIASADLTLPASVATADLPTNSCVYYGPTRVVLNGNGTATITSPDTTSAASGADPACYPSGSFSSSGVVAWTINYGTVGSGAIDVENAGSQPSGGWPLTQQKSTIAASAQSSVFYLQGSSTAAAAGGTASASAGASCTSTVKYAATAGAACAWTNIATATDGGGWTTYSAGTSCSAAAQAALAAGDRLLFECNYAKNTTTTKPTTDQYAALRTAFFTAAGVQTSSTPGATPTCVAPQSPSQASCLAAKMNGLFTGINANSSAGTANVQYVATAATGTPVTSTQTLSGTSAAPMAGDTLFTNVAGSPATQTKTVTPITISVVRQTRTSSATAWSAGTAQFATTVTQTDYSTPTQSTTGTSYFPNTADVTQYNLGSASNGNTASLAPGDLYVEGTNSGVLSLNAAGDTVVTGNLTDANSTTDAIDVVAGNNIRNYHPMFCADQDSGDIGATSVGWCPNDISQLTRNGLINSNNTFAAQHPAVQYLNCSTSVTACATNTTGDRRIDAALFALNGSYLTDNNKRGVAIGKVTVNGGIYQSHRGANGTNYSSTDSNGNTYQASSGYSLQYHYVDLQHRGLPFAPSSSARPWAIISLSTGGTS